METAKSGEKLLVDKHVNFLKKILSSAFEDYEYRMAEDSRMSGLYWCLTALAICNVLESLTIATDAELSLEKEILTFVLSCQNDDGGFGASTNYDSHLLYTLSAIQILALLNKLDSIDKYAVGNYIVSLQNDDGSFSGDKYNEIDSRFSFCALASLSLLSLFKDKQSDSNLNSLIDMDKALKFIIDCQNCDGGFGTLPGSESHAGQIYCCLGFLSISDSLDEIDIDEVGWWLCERQQPSGGLNGRPEKLTDVCYSWWVLSSLKIINRLHWIDKKALSDFIYSCQDISTGGFSDREGNCVDPFHTLFGLAGLQLLGVAQELNNVNPIFCLPQITVETTMNEY